MEFLFFIFHISLIIKLRSAYVITRTRYGEVEGATMPVMGFSVTEYLGIPFAKPPVGELRFQKPQVPDSWHGDILRAISKPPSCPQYIDPYFGGFRGAEMWNPNTPMKEDCLYLNVWSPLRASNAAVMVWFYGGGFYSGSSTLEVYDGRILSATQNVILVSMQYRITALGFATLNHADMPGNLGLWDQLAALEWVQDNIANFGGDPQNVTLFGESAGSASVSFHILSPHSAGKFNRVIMQSGSALGDWTTLNIDTAVSRTMNMAHKLRCSKSKNRPNDEKEILAIIKCLKGIDSSKLAHMWLTRGLNQFPFVPVIDGPKDSGFLPAAPKELLMKKRFNNVPILTGFNENEGTYFMIYHHPRFFNHSGDECGVDYTDFKIVMNHFFKYYPQYPKLLSEVGKSAIRFQYTDFTNQFDSEINTRMVDYSSGDWQFTCPVIKFAQIFAQSSIDVYLYNFVHRSSRNPWPSWTGVMHGDEIPFVFGEGLRYDLGYQTREKLLSQQMMEYWVSFAKTGNPNELPSFNSENKRPHWPRFRNDSQAYILLSAKYLKGENIKYSPKSKECAFWFDYLPQLILETKNISETEREWKLEFNLWKNEYLSEWKREYQQFIDNTGDWCGS